MVWTPAAVPGVYTTGVVSAPVHGISTHTTTTATPAIQPSLHGPVVAASIPALSATLGTAAQAISPTRRSLTKPVLPLEATASPQRSATLAHEALASPRKSTRPILAPEVSRSPSKFKAVETADRSPPSTGDSPTGSVIVGGRSFDRLRELGKGSFGLVWEVQEITCPAAADAKSSSTSLALKCSKPANQQMLEACMFEAEVLQRLAAVLPGEVAESNRVPRYIAHCMSTSASTTPTDSRSGAALATFTDQKVLVVMSKLEGRPLDQWLYGVDENKLKTVPLAQALEGPFPEGVFATYDLAAACSTTCALLRQMAPVFLPLDGIAYHRDVSAHNFLTREEAGTQHFALLDFGLAVRSSTWQHEYQSRNISGDPRYFTPAAWMLMVYGHKYLEAHPDASFLVQYKSRMDHYSFGLLSLEVFFSLWRGPDAEREALSGSEADVAAAGARLTALGRVRDAWRALWKDAVRFFQMFHSKGFAPTREALARSQGVSKYADKLRTLCSELRSAAAEVAADAAVAAVLEITVGLLDPRASLQWRELPGLLRPREMAPADENQGVEVQHEEVRGGQVAGEGQHGNAVNVATIEPIIESTDAAADEGASPEPPVPFKPVRRFSHRRNWTVDEAVSLTRGVREVGMGWGSLGTMPEDPREGGL
mmetsp:Transcript_30197/g.95268  ORF Transcript_30197/g.95268 Transcript_30197/m.95268 type:complete len:653 (+) Transcript_30197:1-1959(+)